MVTVAYDFYRDIHIGKLSEIDFARQFPLAIKQFNNATFNRVTDDIADNDDFRHCICDLIDLNHRLAESAGLSSESDGVTSISYSTSPEQSPELLRGKILSVWLQGYYDLTYRGF